MVSWNGMAERKVPDTIRLTVIGISVLILSLASAIGFFYGIWLILTGKGILEGIFLTIIFNTIIVVMLKARKRSVV